MNTFYQQGFIQNIELPDRDKKKSGILVLSTGEEPVNNAKTVQTVSMVIIRIPPHLQRRASELASNETSMVEVKGRLQGIVKRLKSSLNTDKSYMHTELVAESIYPCKLVAKLSKKQVISHFQLAGVLLEKHVPTSDNKPGELILKYGEQRSDKGRSVEYVNAVTIKTMGILKNKTDEAVKNNCYFVTGHINGVLTSVPNNTPLLDVELIADRVKPICMVTVPAASTAATTNDHKPIEAKEPVAAAMCT